MVPGSSKSLVSLAAASIAASSMAGIALAFTNANNRMPHPSTSRTTGAVEFQRGPAHYDLSSLSAPLFMSSNQRDSDSRNTDSNRDGPADGLGSSSSDSFSTDQYDGLDGSFPLMDDTEISETRQMRWEREAEVQTKFAVGDEVVELRKDLAELREELLEARALAAKDKTGVGSAASKREKMLEREILDLNKRDAEFAYAVANERLDAAYEAGDAEEVERRRMEIEEARHCIPYLNLHGLWVGKYGTHGYEMINVTYSGDTLIATKVTGDKNVPRGESSFTADLSPRSSPENKGASSAPLDPIELNPRAARQWGKKFLPRYTGRGQVASEGYRNAQFMDGQLILVGRFFSFAWVPIGHQVFFGRPSPELTIKMLKEAHEDGFKKDRLAVMRDVVEKCWDETYWTEREMEGDVGGRELQFSDLNEGYYEQEGCFE